MEVIEGVDVLILDKPLLNIVSKNPHYFHVGCGIFLLRLVVEVPRLGLYLRKGQCQYFCF